MITASEMKTLVEKHRKEEPERIEKWIKHYTELIEAEIKEAATCGSSAVCIQTGNVWKAFNEPYNVHPSHVKAIEQVMFSLRNEGFIIDVNKVSNVWVYWDD